MNNIAKLNILCLILLLLVSRFHLSQSPGFLNKCIGIPEIYSESLSLFQCLFFLGGIEKKRGTQNGSLECLYIYSKSLGSGWLLQGFNNISRGGGISPTDS